MTPLASAEHLKTQASSQTQPWKSSCAGDCPWTYQQPHREQPSLSASACHCWHCPQQPGCLGQGRAALGQARAGGLRHRAPRYRGLQQEQTGQTLEHQCTVARVRSGGGASSRGHASRPGLAALRRGPASRSCAAVHIISYFLWWSRAWSSPGAGQVLSCWPGEMASWRYVHALVTRDAEGVSVRVDGKVAEHRWGARGETPFIK